MDDREEDYQLDAPPQNQNRLGTLQGDVTPVPGNGWGWQPPQPEPQPPSGDFQGSIDYLNGQITLLSGGLTAVNNGLVQVTGDLNDIQNWRNNLKSAIAINMNYQWPPVSIRTRALASIPDTIKAEGLVPMFGGDDKITFPLPPDGNQLGGGQLGFPLPFVPPFTGILPQFPTIEIPQAIWPTLVDRPEVKRLIEEYTEGLISEDELKKALEPYLKELPPEVILESEVMRQKFAISVPLVEIRNNFKTLLDYMDDARSAVLAVDSRARWLFGKVQELNEQIAGLSVQVVENAMTSTDVRSIISNELATRGIQAPPFSISDITGLGAKFDNIPTFDDLNDKVRDAISDLTIPTASEVAALVGMPTLPVPYSNISSLISGMPTIWDESTIKSWMPEIPTVPTRSEIFGWGKTDLGITCIKGVFDTFQYSWGTPNFANDLQNIINSSFTGINSIKTCINNKKWTLEIAGQTIMETISPGTLAGCIYDGIKAQLNEMRTNSYTMGTKLNSYLSEINTMITSLKNCMPT